MAVVVNEFEVVPAAEETPPAPRPAEERRPAAPPQSLHEEIERTLRTRAERRARLEAC
jgi:hypothetical protein